MDVFHQVKFRFHSYKPAGGVHCSKNESSNNSIANTVDVLPQFRWQREKKKYNNNLTLFHIQTFNKCIYQYFIPELRELVLLKPRPYGASHARDCNPNHDSLSLRST